MHSAVPYDVLLLALYYRMCHDQLTVVGTASLEFSLLASL